MDQAREATVLFADVSDSTKLYETEGDKAAMQAIASCLERLRQNTESSGGRVVKTIGDEIMAVFATPDAAAIAAGKMQHAIDALAPAGASKLGIRIGFQSGPVIQSGSDVFGDTVNLAARLAEHARRDQIITSTETADRLGAAFRSFKRRLYGVHVKGKVADIELCELIWRQADDVTMTFVGRTPMQRETHALRLKYGGREIVCRRHNDAITMGRDASCGLVVANARTSRQHCTIERRQDKFFLADRSTNGTYVTAEGGSEVFLRREETLLGNHGWIAFGQPRADSPDVVEFFCD